MKYANLIGYSDVVPYEVISVSPSGTQITLREMHSMIDPDWVAEFNPGGFLAHCSNQSDQKWIITSDPNGFVMKAHKRKDGSFHSPYGKHVLADAPRKFRDYNF